MDKNIFWLGLLFIDVMIMGVSIYKGEGTESFIFACIFAIVANILAND